MKLVSPQKAHERDIEGRKLIPTQAAPQQACNGDSKPAMSS